MSQRLFKVGVACLWALFLTGCSEQMSVKLANVELPKLVEAEGKTAPAQVSSREVSESVTFSPAKPDHYEAYTTWLKEHGWSVLTENQEVTSLQTVMTKGKDRITLNFSPSRGLSLTAVSPNDAGTTSSSTSAK